MSTSPESSSVNSNLSTPSRSTPPPPVSRPPVAAHFSYHVPLRISGNQTFFASSPVKATHITAKQPETATSSSEETKHRDSHIVTSPIIVTDYFISGEEQEEQRRDTHRRQRMDRRTMSESLSAKNSKMLKKLLDYIQLLRKSISRIEKRQYKTRSHADGLLATTQQEIDEAQCNMQLNLLVQLQMKLHIQQNIFDTQDKIFARTKLVLKRRMDQTHALVDQAARGETILVPIQTQATSNLPGSASVSHTRRPSTDPSVSTQIHHSSCPPSPESGPRRTRAMSESRCSTKFTPLVEPLTDEYFRSPRVLATENPGLNKLQSIISDLNSKLQHISASVSEVRRQTRRQEASRKRDEDIQTTINEFQKVYDSDSLTVKYEPVRHLELRFSKLLLDERHKEGKAIRKWVDLLDEKDSASIPTQQIITFLERFAVGFRSAFHVSRSQFFYLRLLIHRAVFPRIWKHVTSPYETTAGDKEAIFAKKLEWLRALSQQELGIEPQYCMPTLTERGLNSIQSRDTQPNTQPPSPASTFSFGTMSSSPVSTGTTDSPPRDRDPKSFPPVRPRRIKSRRPYQAAVTVLEELAHLMAPHDMTQCLLHCSQTIYLCAREYTTMHEDTRGFEEIGADAFFPIFLYVIIHARIPRIHVYLEIMRAYSSVEAKMSETGYYLTCFEGAVTYIERVTPEEVRRISQTKEQRDRAEDSFGV